MNSWWFILAPDVGLVFASVRIAASKGNKQISQRAKLKATFHEV